MKKFTFILMAFMLVMASCETTVDPIDNPDNRDVVIVEQDITTNTTWYGNKIYKVTRSIDVTNRALLTIEPGCIIKFVKDVELSIAYNDYGTVLARGTKDKPILFTSESPKPEAGDWFGFYIYDGSEGSEFDYCTIEFAGGYSPNQAAINLRGGKAKFINCTVSESDSYGYEVRNDAEFTGFAYNTVTKTKRDPMLLHANCIWSLGEFNHFDSGTRIEVNHGDLDEPGSHYWNAQPIPFYFSNSLDIGSISATGTVLTLAPGIHLEFAPNVEVGVGYGSYLAKLIAVGEANNPIVFSSSSLVPDNGDWVGIWFYEAVMTGTKIEHCVIEYGGGYSYGGNLTFRNDVANNVEISNSTLSYSGQFGIYKKLNSNFTTPIYNNVTFIDNAMGDVNW